MGSLLNPIAFFFAIEIFRNVIFMMLYPFNDNYVFDYVLIQIPNLNHAFFSYFINQLIFSITFSVVFFMGIRKRNMNKYTFRFTNIKLKYYYIYGFIFLLIGTMFALVFFNGIEGAIYYFTHLNERVLLSKGTTFFRYYWMLLIIGFSFIYVKSMNENGFAISRIITFIVFLYVFFLMSIYGARSTLILFFIYIIVLDRYSIKNTKHNNNFIHKHYINNVKVFTIVIVSIFILFIFVALRNPNFSSYLTNQGIISAIRLVSEGTINTTLTYLNNLNKMLFVFGSEKIGSITNLWYGKSFIDLFLGVIPRSLFENKPPLEEGVYIYSLVNGLNVSPSMPANQMYSVAWPIDTIGVGYANFGTIGVATFAVMLGKIQSFFYINVRNNNNNIFILFIWVFLVFTFSFTNSGIFGLITNFIFIALFFYFVTGQKIRIIRKS